MITIRIPVNLRAVTGGRDEVTVTASTVREVLDALIHEHPEVEERLFDPSGALRRFVLLVLNNETLGADEALEMPTAAGDELSIVPAIAGG